MESHRPLTDSERRRQSWLAMALAFLCAVYAIPLWLFWATWMNWRLRWVVRKNWVYDGPLAVVGSQNDDWHGFLQAHWLPKHANQTLVLPNKRSGKENKSFNSLYRLYRWHVPHYFPPPGPMVVVYPTGKSRVFPLSSVWVAARKTGDDALVGEKIKELEAILQSSDA